MMEPEERGFQQKTHGQFTLASGGRTINVGVFLGVTCRKLAEQCLNIQAFWLVFNSPRLHHPDGAAAVRDVALFGKHGLFIFPCE